MTYVEKMAIEIHTDCIHEDPGTQYEILKATEKLLEQILSDKEAACLDALASKCFTGDYPMYAKAISQAEVKEQKK